MPDVRPLVDVEGLLVDYLEQDAGLGALVGGVGDAARVSTELPAGFVPEGRVKLVRIGGTPSGTDAAEHLDRAVVQLDGFGATKADAFDVIRAALVALRRAPSAAHVDAVVTSVDRISGPTWSPDPETDAPRYLLTVAVTVHPT